MITPHCLCKKELAKHLPDYVLYRDKNNNNYAQDAKKFIEICRKFKEIKAYIHQDVELASELDADGVHLTSSQFDQIGYAKDRELEVIISTHTLKEAKEACSSGADAVTYSPIFYTPHKGEPKGIDSLKELINSVDIKVFALGGITTKKEISEIEKTGAYGFASIRYFE